jgi:hypothetical protein
MSRRPHVYCRLVVERRRSLSRIISVKSSAERISRIPVFTAGCFDINWTAWSRSLASNTPNPPKLLFRFSIRAVGDGHLAALPSQGDGVPSALKRFPTNPVAVLPQPLVVGRSTRKKGILLAFGDRFPLPLVKESKANVFHSLLLFREHLVFSPSPYSRLRESKFDNRTSSGNRSALDKTPRLLLRSNPHLAETFNLLTGPEIFEFEQLADFDLGVRPFARGLGVAPGQASASSLDFTRMSVQPAISSFVPAKGPSMTISLSSRVLNAPALRARLQS